jgi:replicative DNA helicase
MSELALEPMPAFVAKDAEKAVLGASLLYEGIAQAFVAEGLKAQHFWSLHHRTIWNRIVHALREGAEPSGPAVYALLVKHRESEEVGAAYMAGLSDGVPRLGDGAVRLLVKQLVECAVGRATLVALRQAQAQLEDKPASLTEGFFAQMDGSLRSLSSQLAGRRMPDHVTHISDVLAAVRESLTAGPPDFVDTPWPTLTSMLGGGIAPGELVFLGARPGVGKTAAALELARRAAKRGRSVFVVSREMLTVAIGMRMLSQEGPVNATSLRKRDLSPQHWSTIDLAIERLEALPVFMTHAALDIDEIRRIAGIMTDDGPLGLVIVDYLQLIDAPAGVTDRRLQVEAVSKGLKAITIDFGVPVLCLSSLSRPGEGRAPTLASLRESGNLEHDADTVILFHRPEELESKTECIVAKSRNGRTGMVELHFRGEFLRFEEQWPTGVQ